MRWINIITLLITNRFISKFSVHFNYSLFQCISRLWYLNYTLNFIHASIFPQLLNEWWPVCPKPKGHCLIHLPCSKHHYYFSYLLVCVVMYPKLSCWIIPLRLNGNSQWDRDASHQLSHAHKRIEQQKKHQHKLKQIEFFLLLSVTQYHLKIPVQNEPKDGYSGFFSPLRQCYTHA